MNPKRWVGAMEFKFAQFGNGPRSAEATVPIGTRGFPAKLAQVTVNLHRCRPVAGCRISPDYKYPVVMHPFQNAGLVSWLGTCKLRHQNLKNRAG